MKNYVLLIILVFVSILFSCTKERITKDHPEFIGNWTEHTNAQSYHKLHIQNESKGVLSIYTIGNSDSEDHQFRKWRIKNNNLYYGIETNLGEISQYPTIASSDIGLAFNSDTIRAGTKYMILKGSYYTESDQ
ncbi:MAG: hypothetical protein ACXVPU_01790 [Bacteroidia bacterium]